ncbi:FAD-dependent oxidoreductase, partial [Mycobacterium simiae]
MHTKRLETVMRIAIIGAGPAGLAAAIRLRERGYNDVKIYESADRVGGKAMTVEIDGRHYDLGAVLLGQRYPHTLALARKYDIPLIPRAGRRAVIDLETGRWMDIIEALKSRYSPREYLTATARACRYVKRYRKYFDTPGFAFTNSPEVEDLRREISMPISEWARRKNVEPMLARWEPAILGMGYGPYNSIA